MVENSHSKSWFNKRTAIERLRHYLSVGNSKVRLATGYFSVNGWNLIRQAIGDKQVDLIVEDLNFNNKYMSPATYQVDFVERRATIIYLENAVNKSLPEVKVFSTIKTKEDKYVHKSDRYIEKGIKEFAPIANKQ
jgi:hypothetical protein